MKAARLPISHHSGGIPSRFQKETLRVTASLGLKVTTEFSPFDSPCLIDEIKRKICQSSTLEAEVPHARRGTFTLNPSIIIGGYFL